MQDTIPFDHELLELLKAITSEGIKSAARGFSGMVGHKIEVSNPVAHLVPLLGIAEIVGGPENEAVGIYLRIEGDMLGQIMMIIPYQKALELVDLLMDIPEIDRDDVELELILDHGSRFREQAVAIRFGCKQI